MGTPLKPADRFPRRALTVAAAVSLVAAPAFAGAAHAADPVKKAIKISAKQFPIALDRPGTSADKVRIATVAGVKWQVAAVDVPASSAKTPTDVAVSALSVVVTAAPTDAATTEIAGPTSWTLTYTDGAPVTAKADVKATFVDVPGGLKDSVIITKATGVEWTVGAKTYAPEDFGKKTTIALKVGKDAKVEARPLGTNWTDPSDATVAAFTDQVTDTTPVTYKDAVVGAAVSVGDNPLDAAKGYGKGASIETVKVVGIAGLKWRVGADAKAKAVAVKPGETGYLKVDADDIASDGKVKVTPVPDKGYALETTAFVVEPNFTDATGYQIAVVTGNAAKVERGGAASDTVVLAAPRNMTWYFGQKDAKTSKIVYKPQKADKAGNAVYKVKHPKGATTTDVWVKPVANRGFTIAAGGWSTTPYTFDAADQTVAASAVVGSSKVTLTSLEGVDSWTIEDTSGDKTVKTTIKRADLVAAGVTALEVPTKAAAATVVTKYIKGYKG